MSAFGWIGNILLIVGLWKAGDGDKSGFFLMLLGELLWTVRGLLSGDPDLIFVCVVFSLIALRNFLKN